MAYIRATAIFLGLVFMVGCTAAEHDQACEEWLQVVYNDMEGVPMSQKLEIILNRVSRGCPGIPDDLRDASAQAWQADRVSRASTLAQVALSYLPEQCPLENPNGPATALADSCPLPDQHFLSPHLLRRVDAGTYGFIWALATVFSELGFYDSTRKISGRRIVRNLLLATAKKNEASSDR